MISLLYLFYAVTGLVIGLLLGMLTVVLYRQYSRHQSKVRHHGFGHWERASEIIQDSHILHQQARESKEFNKANQSFVSDVTRDRDA